MMEERISIAEAVRRVISRHPTLLDSLINKYGNISAISRYIYDEVIEELEGFHPSLYAIKMSLRRYVKSLGDRLKAGEEDIIRVIRSSQLELINSVSLYTIDRAYFYEVLDFIRDKVGRRRFIHITQGRDTFTLVVDKVTDDTLSGLIHSEYIVEKMDDQSAVIIVSPREIITTPGVISYITNRLYFNGVNITQIISSYLDTIIIINRDDSIRAYRVLEEMIKG